MFRKTSRRHKMATIVKEYIWQDLTEEQDVLRERWMNGERSTEVNQWLVPVMKRIGELHALARALNPDEQYVAPFKCTEFIKSGKRKGGPCGKRVVIRCDGSALCSYHGENYDEVLALLSTFE